MTKHPTTAKEQIRNTNKPKSNYDINDNDYI